MAGVGFSHAARRQASGAARGWNNSALVPMNPSKALPQDPADAPPLQEPSFLRRRWLWVIAGPRAACGGAGLWMGLVVSVSAVLGLGAQPAGLAPGEVSAVGRVGAFEIVERGPHHRVWERVEFEPGPDGRLVGRPRRYVELATGLHYWAEGRWQESRQEIEPWARGCGGSTRPLQGALWGEPGQCRGH